MRKKIVLITTKAITINLFLEEIIKKLSKNYEIKLCSSDIHNINIKNFEKIKILLPFNIINLLNPIYLLISFFSIRKVIKSNVNSVFFVHTPVAAHMLRFSSIFLNIKIVYFVHGFRFHKYTNTFAYYLFYFLERLLVFKTFLYLVINNEDEIIVKKLFRKKYYKLDGIGIDLKKKTKPILNKKKYLVGSVIAYKKNKGILDLIEIAEKLKELPIKFHCYGYGNRNDYKKIIMKKKLKNIKLNGFSKNILKKISTFNILIHPSHREGLPISVLQSMYLSVPVIGRNIRGMSDLIKNNIDSFLISKNFAINASKKIREIFLNKKKILIIKKNLKNKNFKIYSKEIIANKIHKIFLKNF